MQIHICETILLVRYLSNSKFSSLQQLRKIFYLFYLFIYFIFYLFDCLYKGLLFFQPSMQ